MLLTPPDVISQTLLAFPMWILFELGIVFSRFFQKRRKLSDENDDIAAESDGVPAAAAATSSAGSPPGEGLGSGPSAGPGSPASWQGGKSGGEETIVGRDIAGGDPFDRERFAPMTDEEMEAELDAIEAEEDIESVEIDSEEIDEPDPVEQMLARVKELREREDEAGARKLLYQVLEEGDEEQRYVARNILAQLDTP